MIVKFVSADRDGAGFHTAVLMDPINATFPPMTLFTATDVQFGSFEFDGTEALLRMCKVAFGARAPKPANDGHGRLHIGRAQLIDWLVENQHSYLGSNGSTKQALPHLNSPASYPSEHTQQAIDWFHQYWLPVGVDSSIYTVNRTLITVRATYLLPAAPISAGCAATAAAPPPQPVPVITTASQAKLLADSTQLVVGDRMTYVRGVVEIIFARPLTMAEEWARDHEWTDWTGASFRGKHEWDYVMSQPAKERALPNGDVFDQGHEGNMLADFRQLFVDRVAAVSGGDELVPTLEEIAAARMYTGPPYVMLNGFMRLVGRVKRRHWRARLAQLEGFTYSSTVYHLINAIRKITQLDALERQQTEVQQQQQHAMLYRGVRGVLPLSFFEPDVQGFITAVDFGFTSTSAQEKVPVSFMSPDQYNVLWMLHCTDGADSAGQLHNGAVLKPLSQFPAEAETLLPPLCMLQVLREGGVADTTGAFRIADKTGVNGKGEVVKYKEIHARPCFV
jgi:hypothetical protein